MLFLGIFYSSQYVFQKVNNNNNNKTHDFVYMRQKTLLYYYEKRNLLNIKRVRQDFILILYCYVVRIHAFKVILYCFYAYLSPLYKKKVYMRVVLRCESIQQNLFFCKIKYSSPSVYGMHRGSFGPRNDVLVQV